MSKVQKISRNQRSVLMLSYYYPPAASAGVFRTARFVKYLPECGWRPLVVTVLPDALHHHRFDHSLQRLLPAEAVVARTPVWRPYEACSAVVKSLFRAGSHDPPQEAAERVPLAANQPNRRMVSRHRQRLAHAARSLRDVLFATPDAQIGWMVPAIRMALQLIRKHCPRAIYSSGPPHSSHLIAIALKRITGIPAMIDFRDPWARCAWDSVGSETGRQKIQGWLERLCISGADRVVLNTTALLEDFLDRYEGQSPAKFRVITNGYDPDSPFLPGKIQAAHEPHSDNGTVRLCHPGAIYGQRDLRCMIVAVQRLRDSGVSVRFEQIGDVENRPAVQSQIEALGLKETIRLTPRMPYEKTLSHMARADVFVLLQQGTMTQIPGKIFEMLPFGKPVLALTAGDGITAQTINGYELGEVVSGSEPDSIAAAIGRLAHKGDLTACNGAWQGAMREFDGRRLTRQLAHALDEIG